MAKAETKTDLSPERQRLVEQMQEVNFGKIEGIVVLGGEPHLDGSTRIVYEYKFGAENGPRPESKADDFMLKSKVSDFFSQLDLLDEGSVLNVEVKYGLPFRMSVITKVKN